jgi:hypothetical protein
MLQFSKTTINHSSHLPHKHILVFLTHHLMYKFTQRPSYFLVSFIELTSHRSKHFWELSSTMSSLHRNLMPWCKFFCSPSHISHSFHFDDDGEKSLFSMLRAITIIIIISIKSIRLYAAALPSLWIYMWVCWFIDSGDISRLVQIINGFTFNIRSLMPFSHFPLTLNNCDPIENICVCVRTFINNFDNKHTEMWVTVASMCKGINSLVHSQVCTELNWKKYFRLLTMCVCVCVWQAMNVKTRYKAMKIYWCLFVPWIFVMCHIFGLLSIFFSHHFVPIPFLWSFNGLNDNEGWPNKE